MKKIITHNAKETEDLGFRIGQLLNKQEAIILMDGDLAAGKTTMTKGIARALGVKRVINSPTFTIMKQYQGEGINLNHLDLYRLSEVGSDFDLEEYINEGVSVIEWPFQVEDLLPEEYLLIKLEVLENDMRAIELIAKGQSYERILSEI